MRKLVFILFIFIGSIIGLFLLFNTINLRTNQSNIKPVQKFPVFENAHTQLANSIRVPTVADSAVGKPSFLEWIRVNYPLLFASPNISWQQFGKHSLVAKWIGRNTEDAPVVLVASYATDEPKLEHIHEWTYNPMLGKADKDFVYGLGSCGGKAVSVALLEVLQHYVSDTILPDRTIYFAFPGPESTENTAICTALIQANVQPEFMLNTGGLIVQKGNSWNLPRDVAMIGVANQSFYNIKLEAPSESGVEIIEQETEQILASLPSIELDHPVLQEFIRKTAPELSFSKRLIFANKWLLGNIQKTQLTNNPFTHYFFGNNLTSDKIINDSFSRSNINLTLSCPNNFVEVKQWVNQQIQHPKVQLISIEKEEAAKQIAITQNFAYRIVENTCKEVFPELISAPIIGRESTINTWQKNIDTDILYFHPVIYNKKDFEMKKNGIDEKISKDNFTKMLHFYYQLIKNLI